MLNKYLLNEGVMGEVSGRPQGPREVGLCSLCVQSGQVLASLYLVLNVSRSAETNKLMRVCALNPQERGKPVWILGQAPFLACRETGAGPLVFSGLCVLVLT